MRSRNRHGPSLHLCVGLVALVLALGLGAAPAAVAGHPHLREGVTFGAALGYGPGRVSLFPGDEDLQSESSWEAGVTPQFRLGYAVVGNHLLVTAAVQQWLYEQGILAEDKGRVNSQAWTLSLVWCPGKPHSAAGGIQITAGIGVANARLTLLEPVEDDPHGNKFEEVFKEDEQGTAYQFGVGYEFRLTKSLAAGLSASYIYQTIGGEIFEDSASWPLNLTLNWYW